MRTTTTRNKLVRKWMERGNYGDYQKILGSKQQGKGIYILYKQDGMPYYVGKSIRSMRSRVKKHHNDHLKGKWKHFSFYQIPKSKYVGDVERLLLRYYTPKGNRQSGSFRRKLRIT